MVRYKNAQCHNPCFGHVLLSFYFLLHCTLILRTPITIGAFSSSHVAMLWLIDSHPSSSATDDPSNTGPLFIWSIVQELDCVPCNSQYFSFVEWLCLTLTSNLLMLVLPIKGLLLLWAFSGSWCFSTNVPSPGLLAFPHTISYITTCRLWVLVFFHKCVFSRSPWFSTNNILYFLDYYYFLF